MTDQQITKIKSQSIPDIYLQSIQLSDASETYVNWLNDPSVNQYLETRFQLQTIDTVTDFISSMINAPNEHLFTIRLKKTNQHIGNIKVGGIKQQHNIADISLFIGEKSAWGKGYASQAINLISRYSFDVLGLRKLCAGAYEPNKGSTKAFLNVGYLKDSVLSNHYIFNGQPCDLVQVCMFQEQKNTLQNIRAC